MRTLTFLLTVLSLAAAPVSGEDIFPGDHLGEWTRIAIPPTKQISNIAQWHSDTKERVIVCDGNGGHEWLRYNHELTNFEFHVQWRFTKLDGTAKYNSGVFFRNNRDGSIWHQAQAGLTGGYIFGDTPVAGKLQRVNLLAQMKENRVKPAGEWNDYVIRCQGADCTLAVNGEVTSEIHIDVPSGFIGLESEGYRIEFRHLELTVLP